MSVFNQISSIIYAIFDYFRKHVSVTVTSDDKSMYSVLTWLHENGALNNSNSVEVDVLRQNDKYGYIYSRSNRENCGQLFFRYIPAVGVRTEFVVNGQKVILTRRRQSTNAEVREVMKLITYGCDRKFLEDIVEESCNFTERRSPNMITIYTATSGVWEIFWRQKCRPIKSIFLDNGIVDKFVNDIRNFLEAETWYDERSMPSRRGYLLYGPSGCGKTSLIRALATEFDHAICELNLKDLAMSDKTLQILFTSIPAKSFLVIEDIDGLFSTRDADILYEDQYNKVTFSNLLSCIDGIGASSKGRFIFMTSRNSNLDKIDPTLIRPGRIDKRQLIDYPSSEQVKNLLTYLHPDANKELVDDFTRKSESEDRKRSVAELQSHILMYSSELEKIANSPFETDANSSKDIVSLYI